VQEQEAERTNTEVNDADFVAHIPAEELRQRKIEQARKEKPALVVLRKQLSDCERAEFP
jgi:hypothetical protein